MRSRILLLAPVIAVSLFALPSAAHAAIPFFDPIIPAAYNTCPLSWGALIDVVNNIISFLITVVLVFIAPFMIAYSGFLLVSGQGNPGSISKAKGVLLNTIVGIVVAMAGWLIVDAVMAVLYKPPTGSAWGTWSSLVTSGGVAPCLIQAGALEKLNQVAITGISANGGIITPNGKSIGICSDLNMACSPAVIQAAGFSSNQANAMSCIAVTESSGNPNTPNSPTGACGTFQITQGNWNTASLHKSPCSIATSCNDPTCNLQAAYLLSQQSVKTKKSPYQPWICSGCNASAQNCINQYDPGG